MAGIHFVEGYKDFPVCNHVCGVGPENKGYQTGMFDDGLPFEVEEYEYGKGDSKVRELALIMPDLYVEDDDCEEPEYEFGYEKELKEYSVLPIGMVIRGQESSFPIIRWYQEFVEEMGIVEYVSNIRCCSVFYYTDVNGNDLVQIIIGLIINGEEEAVSKVLLRDFSFRKRPNSKMNKSNFKIVK